MKINEITKELGVSRKAILYYEQEGLIKPERLYNDYRDYNQEQVNKIKQINKLRLLNVPVSIIKQYLDGKDNSILVKYCESKRNELYIEQNNLEGLESIISNNEEVTPMSAIQYLETNIPGFFGKYISNNFKYYFEKDKVSYVGNEEVLKEIITYIDSRDWSSLNNYDEETSATISTNIHDMQYKMVANMSEIPIPDIEINPEVRVKTQELTFKLVELDYYNRFIPLIKKLSPSYSLYLYKLEQMGKNGN